MQRLADRVRNVGGRVDVYWGGGGKNTTTKTKTKLKKVFAKADRMGARFVGIVGEGEMERGVVKVKELRCGEEIDLQIEEEDEDGKGELEKWLIGNL